MFMFSSLAQVFQSILRCNVHSVTNMSLLVMPRMVERKSGVVINVSSATALFPSPLLTVYGATKVRTLSHLSRGMIDSGTRK